MPGLARFPTPGGLTWSAPFAPFSPPSHPAHLPGPELQFYISREDGSLVPLVPVDELPHDVRLSGVPLRISPVHAKDLTFAGHLPCVGTRFTHDKFLSIKDHSSPPLPTVKFTPRPEIPSRNPPASQSVSTPVTIPTEPKSDRPKPLYNERPLPPSGVEPDPKKKVYCTYWIQHASCNFAQQGCLYKHEMPNLDTLRSIGIHRYPAWWQKQQARKWTQGGNDSSSSEWEEVDRRQADNSALHSDVPLRVRVPAAHPATQPVNKQQTQKPRPENMTKNGNTIVAKANSAQAVCTSHKSPRGGVRLGGKISVKPPIHKHVTRLSKKPCLDSPVEDDLIDFDVLVPSSSSDISSGSETPTQQTTKAAAVVKNDNTPSPSGGVPVSCAGSAQRRHSHPEGSRRDPVDKKVAFAVSTKRRSGKEKAKDHNQQVSVEVEKGNANIEKVPTDSNKGKGRAVSVSE